MIADDMSRDGLVAHHQALDARKRQFAANLRVFLAASEMNANQLAREMGINRGMVYKWMRGEHLPSSRHMAWLGDYFGWRFDE